MEEEKTDHWRKRIEDELKSQSGILIDLHKELIGGDFNEGVFKEVKQHGKDIKRLDETVEKHDKFYNQVDAVKIWSLRAIGAWVVYLVGKLAYLLYELGSKAWKLAPLADLFKGGNHNT